MKHKIILNDPQFDQLAGDISKIAARVFRLADEANEDAYQAADDFWELICDSSPMVLCYNTADQKGWDVADAIFSQLVYWDHERHDIYCTVYNSMAYAAQGGSVDEIRAKLTEEVFDQLTVEEVMKS